MHCQRVLPWEPVPRRSYCTEKAVGMSPTRFAFIQRFFAALGAAFIAACFDGFARACLAISCGDLAGAYFAGFFAGALAAALARGLGLAFAGSGFLAAG